MKSVDKRRKQVLVIECDSNTLEAQSLAIGDEIKTELQKAFPKNGIDLIKATAKSNFDRELDIVLRKYRRPCKTVILVGHGNESGIKLTSELFMGWQDLGSILEPFAPEQLIFLACRAGGIAACEILFDSIPSLQEIFASPINVSKTQQDIVVHKVRYTLSAKKENPYVVNLLQTANALITKEWMFKRTREEHEYGELGSKQFLEKGILMITDWFKKN